MQHSVIEWLRYARTRWHGTTVDGRNVRMLYADVFCAGIANAVVAFNGVFAVRLGASDALIGVLTSVPPLIVALMTLPAGNWLERRTNQMPLVLWTILLYRLGFLLIALMPLIIFEYRAAAFVFLVCLMTIPTGVFGVGFSSLLADIIPERRRAVVVSWRNIILVATTAVAGYLAGQALDAMSFPMNYQVIYALSFLTSLLSLEALRRIQLPETAIRSQAKAREAPKLSWASTKALWRSHRGYPRIIINTFVYGIGPWMLGPLSTIFFVRTLGASNTWIGLLTTIISLSGIAGYYLWQKVIERTSDRSVLALTTIVCALYPALVALSPSLTPILVLGALYGVISPGLTLSHFNTLLKVCPADRRPSAIALYTMLMNVGAFVSPLIAVALADLISVRAALGIAAAFWLAGGLLFWLKAPEGDFRRPTNDDGPPTNADQ